MKAHPGIVVAAALTLALISPGRVPAHGYMHGEIQVQLREGASIEQVNLRYGTSASDSLPPSYLLRLPSGMGEQEALNLLGSDPDVVDAEYSWEEETPEAVRQTMVAAVGGTIEDYLDQSVTTRIRLAAIQSHTLGEGIKIAVIDTGVLASHPALEGAITSDGWDFVDSDADPEDTANGIDDDGDGLTDEAAGHGTMVAGIIHLVAPAARIMPIRILNDEGTGRSFDLIKAIDYAVEHGAQIINMSLGLDQCSNTVGVQIAAAADAGCVMVSAAGNDGVEHPLIYPAADRHVLSVAALDSCDVKADFSNYNMHVALSAPGVGIRSAFYDGGYAIGAGTSFATPFVTGQAALILSIDPSRTCTQVNALARQGVVGIYRIRGNEIYQGLLGTGRVDGLETWYAAMTAADAPAATAEGGGGLRVFPNPARRGAGLSFTIDGSRGPAAGIAEVFDATGRLLSRGGGAALGSSIGRLPAGTYFIRLREARGRSGPAARLVVTE